MKRLTYLTMCAGMVLAMGNTADAEIYHGYEGGQRVLILGDSISETATYRHSLFTKLTEAGAVHQTDFDFVGARNSYLEDGGSINWDHDFEGHGGFTTDQLITGRGGESSAQNTGMATAISQGKWAYFNNAPDVVCLLTGTNDIGFDWGVMAKEQGVGVPEYAVHETIHDIRNVVAFLRGQNPNVKIALSTGIPTTSDRRYLEPGTIVALKDEIIKLVNGTYEVPADLAPAPDWAVGKTGAWGPAPERLDPSEFISGGIATADSPVILVDTWTGFDAETMTGDGTHPNADGGDLIGTRFSGALIEQQWVPEPITMTYLGLGAAGLAAAGKKRKPFANGADAEEKQADQQAF